MSDIRVFLPMCLGPGIAAWGMARLKEKRQIANTPKSKIRSAAMGMVALSGSAQPRSTISDPISSLPCCWWSCIVEEYRSSGKSSHWEVIKTLTSPFPFYLEDDTGKTTVDPHGAEIYGDEDIIMLDSSTQARLEPAFISWGINDTGWFGLKRMRVRYRVIFPSTPLFVYGEITHRQDYLGDRKQRLLERIETAKKDAEALAKAGVNNSDGTINFQAWDAFCHQQEETFLSEEAAREAAIPDCDRLVVQKSHNQSMVVDTRSEEELLRKLDQQAFWGAHGGIALTAFGIWLSLQDGFSYEVTAGMMVASLIVGILIGSSVKTNANTGGKSWVWSLSVRRF